jgi:4-hydroxy-2-oxoheptanedioate aldolase
VIEDAAVSRLKRKLTAHEVSVGVTLTYPHAGLAESLGHLGFDAVVIDAEHGAIGDHEIETIAMACDLTGCASVLRMSADAALIERYVNIGITGIQIPRTRSVAQVLDVIDAVKFAPHGRRGLGNTRADRYGIRHPSFPASMAAANERTLVMVQIEDAEGIAALADIATLDAVDAVLVGQIDLSNDLGVPGEIDHPAVVAAAEEITRVVIDAGKPLGLGAGSAADVRQALDRGAHYILSSVARCLSLGASSILDAVCEEARQ